MKFLAAAAFAALFIRPIPSGYARALRWMIFGLLAASATLCCLNLWEWAAALNSGNRFESYAFLRGRVAGPVTDFIHYVHPAFPWLPWAPYWWAFYLRAIGIFCPQLFWIPVFRRRAGLACGVAAGAFLAVSAERLIVILRALANLA